MHHPGSVGDYPGYNVQCTMAAAFTPHPYIHASHSRCADRSQSTPVMVVG